MRPSSLSLILIATTFLLLATLPQQSEAGLKRRNPQRPRDRAKVQNPNKRYPKKKSRLASLFGGRRRKGPKRPPPKELLNSEETGVYYYSLPPGATQRPRIILGDELNFNSLGIPSKQQKQTTPSSSPSPPPPPPLQSIEQELNSDYAESTHPLPPPLPIPHRRRPKHSRGPGYRLKDNTHWRDHYVLEHSPTRPYKTHNHPPKVMDSMMRAAGELRNAYKTAVVQSAKVAKFTGHAMGKYFKGVRNIFVGGGGGGYERKDSSAPVEVVTPKQKEIPFVVEEEEEMDSTPSGYPPVHLDWGGSFWKYFYNNRNNNRRIGSLSEIEKHVVVS